MTDLLIQGRVYSAQPPLYSAKKGPKTLRAYSEAERDEITQKITRGASKGTGIAGRSGASINWQRFKGLGEMNVDELRYCALDPKTRILRRLTMADAAEAEAAAEMFDVLMGSDVARRRSYLVNHSAFVDSDILDV